MKFRDIIGNLQSRWKQSSVTRRTVQGLRRYRTSGEIKFPRIYGYRQTPNGIEVVEEEGRIIRLILGMLSDDKSVQEIKRLLDARNLRGRSGNLFTLRDIAAMVKPIYCGRVQTPSGRWVRSEHYRPLVSPEVLRKAKEAIHRLSEGWDFGLLALDSRVFLTTARSG